MITYYETHDPADVSNYGIDFDGALDAGEAIATITSVTVDATAAALGVTIGTGVQTPSVDGTIARYWISVAGGFQANAAYVAGLFALITATITTNSTPARTLQRTAALRIVQSDSSVEPQAPLRTFTSADLNAINKAIASGLTSVKYADGSSANYRSMEEMLRVREIIRAEVTPVTTAPGANPRASLATFG